MQNSLLSRQLVTAAVLLGSLVAPVSSYSQAGRGPSRRARARSFYERVAERLRRDPDLARRLRNPAAGLESLAWMVGDWEVTARVYATPATPERVSKGESVVRPVLGGRWLSVADTYPDGGQDQGFLTYNPASKAWVAVHIDGYGNHVVSTAPRWEGRKLVLTAPPLAILGERVVLRQVVTKVSEREYRVVNEERAAGGRWVPLDEYVYTKR